MRTVYLVLRLLLGLLLLVAGLIKLRDPLNFRHALDAFGFLPLKITIPVAVVLPPFEVLCGLAIILGFRTRAMVSAAAGMLLIFSAVLGWLLISGRSVDCGCFGRAELLNASPPIALVRNLVFLVVAGVIYRTSCQPHE